MLAGGSAWHRQAHRVAGSRSSGSVLVRGSPLSVQSPSHCHGCHGHVNTPGKYNQETAILAGSHTVVYAHSTGRDTLGHGHPQGTPCWAGARGPFLPVPAPDGARASKCFSPGHTPQGQDQPRATPSRASGGSLGSSWGWQRAEPCQTIGQQHLPQGGRAIRVGQRHISINEEGKSGWEGSRAPCSPVPSLKLPLRSTGTGQTLCSLCT